MAINYAKQTWSDGTSGQTYPSPSRLNHMEDGIKASCDAWDSVSQASVDNWATLRTYGKIAVLDIDLVVTGTISPWQTIRQSTLPDGIASTRSTVGVVTLEDTGGATLDVMVNGSTAYLRNRGASSFAMSQKGAYAHGQVVFFIA